MHIIHNHGKSDSACAVLHSSSCKCSIWTAPFCPARCDSWEWLEVSYHFSTPTPHLGDQDDIPSWIFIHQIGHLKWIITGNPGRTRNIFKRTFDTKQTSTSPCLCLMEMWCALFSREFKRFAVDLSISPRPNKHWAFGSSPPSAINREGQRIESSEKVKPTCWSLLKMDSKPFTTVTKHDTKLPLRSFQGDIISWSHVIRPVVSQRWVFHFWSLTLPLPGSISDF